MRWEQKSNPPSSAGNENLKASKPGVTKGATSNQHGIAPNKMVKSLSEQSDNAPAEMCVQNLFGMEKQGVYRSMARRLATLRPLTCRSSNSEYNGVVTSQKDHWRMVAVDEKGAASRRVYWNAENKGKK